MAAKLEVEVGIKNANFKGGLDKMKSDAAQFKGSLTGMFTASLGPFGTMINKVKSGFSGVFTSIKGGLASMGAVLGVGTIVKSVTDTIAYADALSDLSAKLGINTTSLQAWKNHVEQNGASLENLAQAMAKMEVNRDKALKGDEKMIESFAELGVSAEDLESMGLDEIMLKIGSSSMDASTMVNVLGKAALDLKAALAAAAKEGLNFNGVMSEENIRKLAGVADAWTKAKQWMTTKIGNALGGAIDWWEIAFGSGKPVINTPEEDEEKLKATREKLAKQDEESTATEKATDKKEKAFDLDKELADEIKGKESEVKDLEGKKSGRIRAAVSVPVDSLQAVGGGRGGFHGSDRVLRTAERHLAIAERSLAALQKIADKQPIQKAEAWQ
jgi:hypothetical protein